MIEYLLFLVTGFVVLGFGTLGLGLVLERDPYFDTSTTGKLIKNIIPWAMLSTLGIWLLTQAWRVADTALPSGFTNDVASCLVVLVGFSAAVAGLIEAGHKERKTKPTP